VKLLLLEQASLIWSNIVFQTRWIGRFSKSGDGMVSVVRLLRTVALFAAVGLLSPAWATPDDTAFLEKYKDWKPEAPPYSEAPLGSGPHVLLISKRDGAMTQMNYKSGEACRVARDAVRKQVEPPPGAIRPIAGGEPPLTAVCVPQ
jgi:hypothetical protein